jgi:DNA-binding transcriptional ArsR family regulator
MEQGGYGTGADPLSSVFGALADPTRRAILARLTEGDASVAELAAPFTVSQPAVSRHLRVLENAGLISRHRRATARLSHLEAEPLAEATAWLARYQAYWDERFQRLDELLAALSRNDKADARRHPAAKRPNANRRRRPSPRTDTERSR